MLKRTKERIGTVRAAALIIMFIALCVLCVSCGGAGGREPDVQFDDSARTGVLTNVFSPRAIDLPDGYDVIERVKPYCGEDGVRVFVTKTTETGETSAAGNKIYNLEYAVILISVADGSILSEENIDVGMMGSVQDGCITDGGVSFINLKYSSDGGVNEYYLCTYKYDGGFVSSSELSGMIGGASRFYVNSVAVDSDGYAYLNTPERIVVLNGSMEEEFDLRYDGIIRSLQVSADGKTVYAVSGNTVLKIDRESRGFADEIKLETSMSGVYFPIDENDAENGGFDFYYSGSEGIFGVNFPDAEQDDKAAAPELVMSYPNSDLVDENMTVMAVISRDRVLAFDSDRRSGYEIFGIYEHSPDVDLSQVKVIEYAFPYTDFDTYKRAAAYNKMQNDVRIVVRDYSKYYTSEDPELSDKMLAEDIATGRYCPDIVTTMKSTNLCVEQIRQHGLYVNLYDLIEQSDNIEKDDIFGCVRRSYEDEYGALWAIGRTIDVRTILGNGAFTKDYEGGWTVVDMLSLKDSLPDGAALFGASCTSGRAAEYIFGSRGFSEFVSAERGKCDFGGKAFESYLQIAASLPENYVYSKDNSDELYVSRVSGKVALYNKTYRDISDFLADEAVFNTKDYVRLGYPGAEQKKSAAQIDMRPFIITTECRYPDEAWDFIEYLLGISDLRDSGSYTIMGSSSGGFYNGLFALKSKFDEKMESLRGETYVIGLNGRISTEADVMQYGEIPEPKITRQLTDELVSAVRDWLENTAGEPVPESVGDKITEIVNEEASAYIAGAKNAADCAGVVNSRVQILLDERG